MSISIQNPTNNQLISDILKDMTSIIEEENINKIEKNNIKNQKGEIISSIVISIISATLYDIVKSLIKKYSSRADYDKSTILIIDGKEVSIEDIIKK